MDLVHAAQVPAGEGPFPTLVALHGWGASAQDLLGLAPHLAGGRLQVLCPQGPVSVPLGPGHQGFGWFPLVPGQPPDPVAFAKASTSLKGFIDQALERYPIDPRRLAVLGFSQGGIMAYDLALRWPATFCGLAALSSWLPQELAQHLPREPEARDLPTLVIHGTEDSVVPVERGRESRTNLESFGVQLTYEEFPMGHEIRPAALASVERWIQGCLLP
ncbi:MAG: dienelactone hydrolase family protein [Acidobacteriota bacterium]